MRNVEEGASAYKVCADKERRRGFVSAGEADTLRSNRVIGLSGKQSMKSRAGRGDADGERA